MGLDVAAATGRLTLDVDTRRQPPLAVARGTDINLDGRVDRHRGAIVLVLGDGEQSGGGTDRIVERVVLDEPEEDEG